MVTKGVFKISLWKIGPTEIRVMAILANTVVFFVGNPVWITPLGEVSLYNTIVLFVAALLLVFFIYEALRTGGELAKEDDFSRQRREERERQRQARRAQKEREKMMRKARKSSTAHKSITGGVSSD
jgi:amino acid permease